MEKKMHMKSNLKTEKNDRLEQILEQLRDNGCRITSQRKLLIGVILDNECSSCKDIYYSAKKLDATVGIATVYRTVKALEDLNVINRKNMYDISCRNMNIPKGISAVRVCEACGHIHEIEAGMWYDLLIKQLEKEGSLDGEVTVVIKQVCEHCSKKEKADRNSELKLTNVS